MTRVQFYSNVTDKQAAIAVLARRALARRNMMTIMAESEQSAQGYSEGLWQQGETSFLPNVLASHALAKTTPIVIDWQENQLCQDDILINLSHNQLTVFSRFKHFIELVGTDEQDKVLARQRYKFYRDRGYEVKHLDAESLTQ